MKTKKYRIKVYTNSYTHKQSYEVQKKSIFGFWYNPFNIDAYCTGNYDTFEDAKQAIIMETSKNDSKICYKLSSD